MSTEPKPEEVAAFLGGRRLLGSSGSGSLNWHDAITAGLPARTFESARRALEISEADLAGMLGIPRSTLTRRKAAGRLDVHTSERLVRLGRIAALGRLLLGSYRAVGRWLEKPNRALGFHVPAQLLATDVGAREVEDVLGRALVGGYS